MKSENNGISGETAYSPRGSALIAVLCFVMLVTLLAASSVTLSQIVNHISRETSNRGLSSYYAEGAGARAMWLLMYDKRKYPERSMGLTGAADTGAGEGEEEERFLADGTTHSFESAGIKVEVRVYDMTSGADISGKIPSANLKRSKDEFEDGEQSFDDYLAFLDCLDDYVDPDSFVKLHGAEKDEYLSLGLPPLPRNSQFQFREEIMWIPGANSFFKPDEFGMMKEIQIIPPKGMPKVLGKKNFFSVTKNEIMSELGMSAVEADKVIEARKIWEKEKKPLEELLDPEVLAKLKNKYSFKESGYYTFIVRIVPGAGNSERIFTFSLKLDSRITAKELNYFDWKMF